MTIQFMKYEPLFMKARCGNKESLDQLIHDTEIENRREAKAFMMLVYWYGIVVEKDEAKSLSIGEEIVPWLMSLKENDMYDSQEIAILNYLKGFLYDFGVHVGTKSQQAFRYYKLSADAGNAMGQNNVGYCYASGEGVERNQELGFKYFKLSADQGHMSAQAAVGYCYQTGKGVEINLDEAFRYYMLSANQGDTDALYSVGCCYHNGQGVEKNLKEAFRYFKLSADKLLVGAQ